MSLSAAFVLAAAAAAPAQHTEPAHRIVLAEARVTAVILPSAIVRQASGWQRDDDTAPRPRLSRRGSTILVEFQ
jgi:hypothetical protein